MEELHPLVAAASAGELPPWATAGEERRAHMERVAGLLDRWAEELDLPARDRMRWKALGFLHDCLKGASADELRRNLSGPLAELPEPLLHGPATATRLEREGVEDRELLDAVRYHTLGHPRLGPAGRALYAADFLEPGRNLREGWREGLRRRMPREMDDVVRDILRARIVHLLDNDRPVREETTAFWNSMTGGEGWARASEV